MSQPFYHLADHPLLAGMTSFTLTDIAEARIEVISFFLLVILLSSWVVKLLWNVLARDFPAMPKIRYNHALAIFTVTGLFLYVVLTMISGARELMTPGAWEKTGATYKLKDGSPSALTEVPESTRRLALRNLFDHLKIYADNHDGTLPPKRFAGGIPGSAWIAADGIGVPFQYFSGGKPGDREADRIIACEPSTVGDDRFVLFGDGQIGKLHWKTVRNMVNGDE